MHQQSEEDYEDVKRIEYEYVIGVAYAYLCRPSSLSSPSSVSCAL